VPNDFPLSFSLNDYTDGFDYLEQCRNNKITDKDILLMISLDGAQLYEHRNSDCWMFIWVILELSPDQCYKKTHVLPGGIIPGPNKPKTLIHIFSQVYTTLLHCKKKDLGFGMLFQTLFSLVCLRFTRGLQTHLEWSIFLV
jgi:hypothetical protein